MKKFICKYKKSIVAANLFGFLCFGFMLTQGLNRLGFKRVRPWQFHNWYLWGGLTLLIVNFILKNVLRLGFGIIMH